MPSEAQEPQDRGPAPPITRAGRSAHLAKVTATISPAPERRPRGRPRKDGNSGHSTPPAPPVPPPLPAPPPPSPKLRKKGRTRGRAQVEDEQSVDTTEKKTQKTELKEKRTGCRRSSSRRKSNTNPERRQHHLKLEHQLDTEHSQGCLSPEPVPDPEHSHYCLSPGTKLDPEPSQDYLGPEPEPDPEPNQECVGPGPELDPEPSQTCLGPEPQMNPEPELDPEPHLDHLSSELEMDPESHKVCLIPELDLDPEPTVLESCPEPLSSAVEDRGSPAPSPHLPSSNPKKHGVSPQPPSWDFDTGLRPASGLRPAPDPDPMEKDWHSPCHSPVPLEVVCNSAVIPMEQSPNFSSCSSPLVSPSPRLEDEDLLSPLFQQSLSEDSGGSPTPVLGRIKKRVKQCAFCYRSNEQPPLGQGRLVVFGPTPGYIPLHILNRRASSDRDTDCHDHCYRGDQAPLLCSSPEQNAESSSEFEEQLGPIGLPHDINVQSLFDATGQCCAHLQCAAWSEGVCRGEGQSLLYVDKAIDSGSTQMCAFCRRLGASLHCQEVSCGRSYHFPCAAAAGAQQDWTQRHTLCTRHKLAAASQCVSCSGGDDISGLLMCCCCGNCYHGNCLDPPMTPSLLCRAGWQCPQCRVCQSCSLRGDDGMLLVCERCDKAYHTYCLTPPLDHRPRVGWSCKNCRICRCCGVRSSGKWANHPFLCKSCDPALPCPLCDRPPKLYSPQDTLTCVCCYRCVHTECVVGRLGDTRVGSEDYVCSNCGPQGEDLILHSPNHGLPLSPTQASTVSISQPPLPGHAEAPDISQSVHSPVTFVFSESPQSHINTVYTSVETGFHHSPTLHQDPTESYHNPAPLQTEPTDNCDSPTPPHRDSKEPYDGTAPLQTDPTDNHHSPTPPLQDPSEPYHGPAPLQTKPTDNRDSPTPPYQDPAEPHHVPAPCQPEPTDNHHSPTPPHQDPTEPYHGPAPLQTEPTDNHHSPTLPHHDPAEPYHGPAPLQTEPTDNDHNLAPPQTDSHCSPTPPHEHPKANHTPASPQQDPTEPLHTPATPQPEPTDNHHSPIPPYEDPKEPLHTPASPHQHPTEPLHTPASPQQDPTEPLHSAATPQQDPTEPLHSAATPQQDPTEPLHSAATPQQDPTEPLRSAATPQQDPTEPIHSAATLQQDPTEPLHSAATPQQDPTEPLHTSATPQQDPTEPIHTLATPQQDPTDLHYTSASPQQDATEPYHCPSQPDQDPTELNLTPAPLHLDSTEPHHCPLPPHQDPAELHHSPAAPEHDLTEPHHSPTAPAHDLTEPHHSPAAPEHDLTEPHHSPAAPEHELTEHHHSPAAPEHDLTEHHHSPAAPEHDLTEPHHSLAAHGHDLTEPHHSLTAHEHDLTAPHHSPAAPEHDLTEPHHSPALPLQVPLVPHPCPSLSHYDPTESPCSSVLLQPEVTEPHHSSAPPEQDLTDPHHNLAHHQDPLELKYIPAPPQPEPMEFRHNHASIQPEPIDLQHSTAPYHPEPIELQHSPTQTQPEPTELQRSPTQTRPEPIELQRSPTQTRPEPTELQHNPTQTRLEPTELQRSPTQTRLEPTELQRSPTQTRLEPTELQRSPTQTRPQPTELQRSPTQTRPEPTEHQRSPTQTRLEPTELQRSPTQTQPDLIELQCSEAEPEPTEPHFSPESRELHHNPASPIHKEKFESTKIHHSPAPHHSIPTWFQHSSEPEEPKNSPAPHHSELVKMQYSPSHSELTELQNNHVPPHPLPSDLQGCPQLSCIIPSESKTSLSTSHLDTLDLELSQSTTLSLSGPSVYPESLNICQISPEIQQSLTHETSNQAQDGPDEHTYTYSQNHAKDPLIATTSQQSLTQGSPMLCIHRQSPDSSTQVQPRPSEFWQGPPPDSPVQSYLRQAQPEKTCITDIIFTQPQHSPLPDSAAHVSTPQLQSPTLDSEPTLDQESPGSNIPTQLELRTGHSIFTLDFSPIYCRSTRTVKKHTSPKSFSAPCSPSAAPPRTIQCSLSQPPSPKMAVQQSPPHDGQTLETIPSPLSTTSNLSTVPSDAIIGKLSKQLIPVHSRELSLDHSSPFPVPSHPTPGSLVQRTISVKYSSLASTFNVNEAKKIPPPAQSPLTSPLPCTKFTDLIENSSPGCTSKYASQMPTSSSRSALACSSPILVEPSPVIDRSPEQPDSLLEPLDSCSLQPLRPQPVLSSSIHLMEVLEVAADHHSHCTQSEMSLSHTHSIPESLGHSSSIHTEAKSICTLLDSVHAPESTSSSVCGLAEVPQPQTNQSPHGQSSTSHVPSLYSPSQSSLVQRSTLPTPGSCSPLRVKPANSLFLCSQTTSNSSSISNVSFIHSPSSSSPAGQASSITVQITSSNASSGPLRAGMRQKRAGLANATLVCSPQSPSQASESHCSPHHSPVPNSANCLDLSSSLDVNMMATSIRVDAVLPSVDHLKLGPVRAADSLQETSLQCAISSPNDSSMVSQSPANPLLIPNRSVVENQQSTSMVSLPCQKPATHIDAISSVVGPSHDSLLHCSPTQDNTVMSCTIKVSKTVSPTQASSFQTVHGSAVESSDKQVNPLAVWSHSVKLETSTSPAPDSPIRFEASPFHEFVSKVQPNANPESLQLIQRPGESAAIADVCTAEEDIQIVPRRKTEEEEEEREEKCARSPEQEKPSETIKPRGKLNQEEEEEHNTSNCPPAGVQQGSLLAPYSTIPSHQASSSTSPTFSITSSPSSPLPSRAGPVHSSPFLPHRTALFPPKEELTNQGLLEEGEAAQTVFSLVTLADQHMHSQAQPVTAKGTEDEHQSHVNPSERGKGPPETPEPTVPPPAEEQGLWSPLEEEGGAQKDQSQLEEESVSPVLEMDPSLDMEVIEMMSSASPPPSFLHLASPSPCPFPNRGKGRTLRPPPCSSRPSDDLSIRLRQSPFSTEASPETSPTRAPITPPPLSPPSPPLRSSPTVRESVPLSKAPPSSLLVFTPKIGMGKPAISKRKFSPGRARIKQGLCWSSRRVVSPPSSSQDSMGEGGWDSPKSHPLDSPLWSMRMGRGSGFPGRRRSRGGGVGGGRGARGRSRLKTQDNLTVSPGSVIIEPFQPKEEEENSMHNTVVMFSTSDHFTLRQDMCVVCGSFGQGAEGRLLACSQCGQCYHPYCVNIKMMRVVLTKGWRCLECTVCEACGEASDPGRLLLCDDCDISYHTYCLDPPLHTVPKGAWKCKWCVRCVQCGTSSPGLHCDWLNNYSLCGPCDSLSRCPLCQSQYTHDDLIMQCQQCDRWVHAVCQGLTCENEVEASADEGFDCSLCRTHSHGLYGSTDSLASPFMAQIISRFREPDLKTYTQDGVCLTESGLTHLQSLVEPLMSLRRYRRCKPKLKLRIINQNSVSMLQTPAEPDTPTEQDHRGEVDCDMKSDSSPERDQARDYDITREPEVTDDNKKKKRKPYRPGIGGFMVRQRGGKSGLSRIKLCRRDSSELRGRAEDVTMETAPPADQTLERVKKRYRKKKTKLEEVFPSYLQEAFFGRDLLDQSRQVERRPGSETPGASQSGAPTAHAKGPTPTMATNTIKKHGTPLMSEGVLLDLSDVLNTHPHILATGHTGHFQVVHSPSPFGGLDITSTAEDPSLAGSVGRGQRAVQEEPLDAILSPELDKMVTEGAILSKLYKIPELEGKDVEEVFTAVLSPNSSNNQPEHSRHTHAAAESKTHTHHHTAAVFPRLPLMNGLMGAAPHFPNSPMIPSGAQGAVSFRLHPPQSHAPASLAGPTHGQASSSQGLLGEVEQDSMSTAQKSMMKWEKEEALGEMATVAPVLYCNTNFPQLRAQYPEWSTRVKQIAKLWRKASSQDRAPFVQKARENRAAQRINKVQLSNDLLKRRQLMQTPAPGPFEPISVETEDGFKDPLKSKESEQEQEWKLRQGEVNDRWGAGKKRQEKLPQSKALKSPTDKDCPYQASVAGGGKEALQMRQKSKQQAKMEATQKLEQVKNEQRQQQLAAQRLTGLLSPEPSSHSPMTPITLSNVREGQSKQHLMLPKSSGQADDVFLRPQAPPPSGFISLPHSPHPLSPLHQPPSSPQMFSPPSSRPSSPWDSYSKVAGTPRPTSSQAGSLPAPQQQRRNSFSTSPAHDVFSSPAPSPDSKTPSDVSRNLLPQQGLQQSRGGLISPSSGSGPDILSHHVGLRQAENFQRCQNSGTVRVAVSVLSGRVGDPVRGSLFKTPMAPQHQPQQEVLGGAGGGRRDLPRCTDMNFVLPQSQDSAFPSSPLSGLGSPHRSPYAQMPGTPRPEYSQITDPLAQQSPPYVNPQTPGTPRPHSDPTYLLTPPTLRLDQYTQQGVGHRPSPSPSHQNTDPYSSNPGTPHPSGTERFPRSPGSQCTGDATPGGTLRPSAELYGQQPSTLRPQKTSEAFNHAPVDGFTPKPAGPGSSPLAPETLTPTLAQLQESPGQQHQQQDSFPRAPANQNPKTPAMLEESGFSRLTGQTPVQDPFEQGLGTPCQSQTDKTTTNEMAALAVASLDGPMGMLPQLGDSEEKLRQRQRLRQLILRQQQQKSALRQEKGLQEGAAGPLCHWSQEDSSNTPLSDPYGCPPPPYPGTVRPAVAPPLRFSESFPTEQIRGISPREQGVQGPMQRFAAPPAGLQDSFLRPPQGSIPESGLVGQEGVPVQMKRPGEFTGIRPLTAASSHVMPGVPQSFLPRSPALQQHSIMGQPYIELRHRAPENRLRLPFPPPAALQPGSVPVLTQGGQQTALEQQHLVAAATMTQSGESLLPGTDGMEEHLEGEDSAVKDLEDVEVKDLVDLNLNLDPEDGKEDLDLGPNDLHLDDFLLSGKFDLIAYADPELNLEDKKDMFSEELDLGEAVEEKERGARKTGSQVKQEMRESTIAAQPASISSSRASRLPGGETVSSSQPCSSTLHSKVEESGTVPVLQAQDQASTLCVTSRIQPHTPGGQTIFQQRPFGSSSSQSSVFISTSQGLLMSPHASVTDQAPSAPSQPMPLPTPRPHLLLATQTQPPHSGTSTQQNQNLTVFSQKQIQDQNQNKPRPLLLEEQPLLLQDLLDQERQEQQQQKQMQSLIRQRSTPDHVIQNMDFDSISDPIMKAKMVALKGINKVMSQGNLGLNPVVINRMQQAPVVQGVPVAPGPEGTPQPLGQEGKLTAQLVRPSPPSFGPGFDNESQRQQYEEWLGETQQLLQMQQRLLEEQIAAHRKTKKSLSAKQRTARKAGRTLAEEDAAQLRHVTELQGAVQKQLEQIRKQQKDHTELIEDYRTKQQQQRTLPQASAAAPPLMPQAHPQSLGGPTPVRVPSIPSGWTPGVVAQRIPPQMPPTLPSTPQAEVLGFVTEPQGPTGGPMGRAGSGAAPPHQVNYDDNNPFSEGFQERERRERLREQQERQRVQLLQEVERQRVLQQRLELEQQGLAGAPVGPGLSVAPSGAHSGPQVGQTLGPGCSAGSALAPTGDSLSQMPFFSSEQPQDFLQKAPLSGPNLQRQAQPAPPFHQHGGLHQGFRGRAQNPHDLRPGAPAESHTSRISGPARTQDQPQTAEMSLLHPGGQVHLFGRDSSSSSPSTPNLSSSGGRASLIQIHSDIIPDDKSKKRRKGDTDDTGARTPLSSHSDDITAPPTPAVSDTSCSTPSRGSTDQSDVSFSVNSALCGLAPSSELEKQLSVVCGVQQRCSPLGLDCARGPSFTARLQVKEEQEEGGPCGGGVLKMEEGTGEAISSPSSLHVGPKDGDSGKELLRHLLKDKTSPVTKPTPTSQAPPTACRQLSNESIRSEEEDMPVSYGNMDNSLDQLDPSTNRMQRCKRLARPDKEKLPPKNKRKKREEEETALLVHCSSSSDLLTTHLTQLSMLPLMEPVLAVDLSLFPPYGSSSLGRDSRLSGSFGNASLDGVTDFYSQLIYKQNNLSNPPTPPASLPPTPPPVAWQKLLNGFATTDELSRNDVAPHEAKGMKQRGEGLVSLNHTTKTVDVPASLPTPPHNNQEELRVQEPSEPDSPNSYVPSSSPESVADVEVSRYPNLSFIKLEPPSPCTSPSLPITPSSWGKASAVKQEVKAEPTLRGRPTCSNTDLVTIAITLNPVAAQNVAGVVAVVAQLLQVPVPVDYQLCQPTGPELAGVHIIQGSAGSRQQRPPPGVGNTGVRMDYTQRGGSATAAVRPQCCSYCKGMLGEGVCIVRELKQEGQSRPVPSLLFCSPNCSALFSKAGNKAVEPIMAASSECPCSTKVQHQYTNNMSSIAVHSLVHNASSPPATSSSPPFSFPPASTITMEMNPRMDSLKVKVKLKPCPRMVAGGEDSQLPNMKRMKICRWRRWSVSITLSRGPCIPNEVVSMPTEEEVDVLLKQFGASLRPEPLPRDQRRCCFCNQQGDGETDGPARLLNLDLDLWVHLNCALWSSEVYETQAGALINVELALRRGLSIRCAHCQQTGATSGCNRFRCTNTYHFPCAVQANCTFFKDKTMLCHFHKPRMVPLGGDKSSSCPSSVGMDSAAMMASDPYDSELRCFTVFRRVFVQRDEARQLAALVQRSERQHTFRVGSLLFRSVGRLLPQQMSTFHNKAAIFPIGYHANRIYWSMRHSNRRCKYMSYIEEQDSRPLFKVKVVEKGYDDIILTGATPKAVWDQILEPISQMRSSSGTLKLFPVYLKGEDLFGLTTSAVTRIIESLPGVENCERYTFRYGRNPLMEWPLAFNPSGSARSEPKACHTKRSNLLTSIAPRCQGTVGSIVGLVPGVISLSPGESVAGAHQGRHSKSSQYRRMKAEWKSNVYLARSRIQGLGLYAARDIEKCTMVIEYIGTIIRSEVANRKERLYESQNRGVYMFRIDNDYVIDATITGGPARYINHSCSPNCITEVVNVEKENKIIISSCRRIQRGEELSYDYKFDLEDDQHKIPCHCGAVNCRKWMN